MWSRPRRSTSRAAERVKALAEPQERPESSMAEWASERIPIKETQRDSKIDNYSNASNYPNASNDKLLISNGNARIRASFSRNDPTRDSATRECLSTEPSVQGRSSPPLPAGWVHRQEPAPLCPAQRKVLRRLRRKERRTAKCRTAAHQQRRIRIVGEADRMPELMRDHVAHDIGQRRRRGIHVADHDHGAVPAGQTVDVRDELAVRQHDYDLARLARGIAAL